MRAPRNDPLKNQFHFPHFHLGSPKTQLEGEINNNNAYWEEKSKQNKNKAKQNKQSNKHQLVIGPSEVQFRA